MRNEPPATGWSGWLLRGMRPVRPALLRLLLLATLATAIGWLTDPRVGLWFGVLSFGFLVLFHTMYLAMLSAWLEDPRLEALPEGVGAWSIVFGRLYRAYRGRERTQRRLVESEERFRRTVSALPEGIVLIDRAFQIEWCNPVAESHMHISLQADAGLRLTNLVRDPAFIAYMTSGNYDEPLTYRPISRPGLVLSVLMVEFEPTRSIVVTRDITQAERLDAMRRDFVANVSHELRTPLTVVSGFVETLLDAQPPLDDLRRRHLALMHEQADRMHGLIEDLLLLSGLESEDKPRTEDTVAIGLLMRELADEARVLSQGRHQIHVGESQAVVRGSRDELRSAFSNLVSNAVRYTPPGGRVSLRWTQRPDGGVFEVEDSGIGIAAEHIPRLTERFYRVEKSRSRETGGTGLGLAIVKHVLLRHNGRLEVRSSPGSGSTFGAWLPGNRVVTPAPADAGALA